MSLLSLWYPPAVPPTVGRMVKFGESVDTEEEPPCSPWIMATLRMMPQEFTLGDFARLANIPRITAEIVLFDMAKNQELEKDGAFWRRTPSSTLRSKVAVTLRLERAYAFWRNEARTIGGFAEEALVTYDAAGRFLLARLNDGELECYTMREKGARSATKYYRPRYKKD